MASVTRRECTGKAPEMDPFTVTIVRFPLHVGSVPVQFFLGNVISANGATIRFRFQSEFADVAICFAVVLVVSPKVLLRSLLFAMSAFWIIKGTVCDHELGA